MLPVECIPGRRNFLKGGVGLAFGLSGLAFFPDQPLLPETHGS